MSGQSAPDPVPGERPEDSWDARARCVAGVVHHRTAPPRARFVRAESAPGRVPVSPGAQSSTGDGRGTRPLTSRCRVPERPGRQGRPPARPDTARRCSSTEAEAPQPTMTEVGSAVGRTAAYRGAAGLRPGTVVGHQQGRFVTLRMGNHFASRTGVLGRPDRLDSNGKGVPPLFCSRGVGGPGKPPFQAQGLGRSVERGAPLAGPQAPDTVAGRASAVTRSEGPVPTGSAPADRAGAEVGETGLVLDFGVSVQVGERVTQA